MAALFTSKYNTSGKMEFGDMTVVRKMDFIVDLAVDVTSTAAADTIALASLPAGTVVLAAGIEQIVAGTAGNTLVAQVGTITMSGTLASDATAGTYTANADVAGGSPVILTAAQDFRLLSATAARVTGKVRAFAIIIEGSAAATARIAARDASV